MKKIITFLILLSAICSTAYSQTPQGINYKVIARNDIGNTLADTELTFTINIIQNNTTVYAESHTLTSSQYGLCQMIIGSVNPTQFETVDWSISSSVAISATESGQTYDFGTAQFQSVPYALYSQTAHNLKDFDLSAAQEGYVLVYKSGKWVAQELQENNGWSPSGNTGTTNGTDFIGTTDAQDLDIRTNDIVRHRFTQQGQLEFLNTGNSVFIGEGAGANDDLAGNPSIFIGYNAGNAQTTEGYNLGIGNRALQNNTGAGNTAIGHGTLSQNTTAEGNTAIGSVALNKITTATANTAIGYRALYDFNPTLSQGTFNTAVGYGALQRNKSGQYNTALGGYAMLNTTTGGFNTGLGSSALYANTEGSNNVAIGYNSLSSNIDGNQNIATGYDALKENTEGSANTATGYQTLSKNTEGNFNAANGAYGLFNNTTGDYNTSIGYYGGIVNTTGSNNTYIGYQTNATSGDLTNATAIGNGAIVGASNALILGNDQVKVGIGTDTPLASLDLSQKTDGIAIPSGTTAEQPGTTPPGTIRFNSDGNYFEGYNGTRWVRFGKAERISTVLLDESFGVNNDFMLSQAYTDFDEIQVYGVYLGTDVLGYTKGVTTFSVEELETLNTFGEAISLYSDRVGFVKGVFDADKKQFNWVADDVTKIFKIVGVRYE